MKQFNGYKAEAMGKAREILPAGGYVAKIGAVEMVTTAWGDRLILSFEIVEGDYRGFFGKDYQENINEDKKWRGVYRLNIPADDGSEEDAFRKRIFGNAMYAFEQSNQGYHWDWDETKLKSLIVGVLFRNKEWEFKGKTGWTTECYALTDAASIRSGNFTVPKDKPLANKPKDPLDDLPFTVGDDGGLV